MLIAATAAFDDLTESANQFARLFTIAVAARSVMATRSAGIENQTGELTEARYAIAPRGGRRHFGREEIRANQRRIVEVSTVLATRAGIEHQRARDIIGSEDLDFWRRIELDRLPVYGRLQNQCHG